jgi:hypothetical protein
MSDDFYWNMYGGGSAAPTPTQPAPAPDKFKMASRVIGGMKAQNSHTVTLDVNGVNHTFPKAEYVTQLETQIREARTALRDLETKQARLIKANNRVMERLRQMENDLANKVDLR